MSELHLTENMDEELIKGMGSPLAQERLNSIEMAANSGSSELETESIKTGVSEAIKNLDMETREMFPDKKEVAETVIEKQNGKEAVNNAVAKKEAATIFGMKPLTFGLVVLALGVGGYFAYKNFKK